MTITVRSSSTGSRESCFLSPDLSEFERIACVFIFQLNNELKTVVPYISQETFLENSTESIISLFRTVTSQLKGLIPSCFGFFKNEIDEVSTLDIIVSFRNFFSYCFLIPSTSHLIESISPGLSSVLYPWLLKSSCDQLLLEDNVHIVLLYLLSSRLLDHVTLSHYARDFCSSITNIETVYSILQLWVNLLKTDVNTEINQLSAAELVCFVFQSLGASLKICNENVLISKSCSDMHCSKIIPYTIEIFRDVNISKYVRICSLNYLSIAFRLPSLAYDTLLIHHNFKSFVSDWFLNLTENASEFTFNSIIPDPPVNISDDTVNQMSEGTYGSQFKHMVVETQQSTVTMRNCKLTSLVSQPPSKDVISIINSNYIEPFNSFGIPSLNLWIPSVNTGDCLKNHSVVIETAGFISAFQQIVLNVINSSPCLLIGPSGSGKSFFIQSLYDLLQYNSNDDIVWLYIDEETDSKSLLGTWESADKPGEFQWKDGILARAMKNGRWVVIENIDQSSLEVQVKLHEILENRSIFVSERNQIINAHRNFQIFGTITTQSCSTDEKRVPKLLVDWRQIELSSLTRDDILKIIKKKYPTLAIIAEMILNAFISVMQANTNDKSLGKIRECFGISDFFKYCKRVYIRFMNSTCLERFPLLESTRLLLVQEFYWSIVMSVPDISRRYYFCELFASTLTIVFEQVRQLLRCRPSMTFSRESVIIGDVFIPRDMFLVDQSHFDNCSDTTQLTTHSNQFSYTGIHSRVLQAALSALSYGEPVLLVGDTGAGKTTLVQHLADIFYKDIVIYNFNDQSEAADLVGRTIPEDACSLVQRIRFLLRDILSSTYVINVTQRSELLSRLDHRYIVGDFKGYLMLCTKVADRCLGLLATSQTSERVVSKTDQQSSYSTLLLKWTQLKQMCEEMLQNPLISCGKNSSMKTTRFRFEEGALIKALRLGGWLVLDEINLAPADILQRIRGLLSPSATTKNQKFVLTENDGEEICPHPDFRIFGCMNPPIQPLELPEDHYNIESVSSDITLKKSASYSTSGKKELPSAIRQCFTELFVDEVWDIADLEHVITQYLPQTISNPASKVAEFYIEARKLSLQNLIINGAGTAPHFSLRTLVRAVQYAKTVSSRNWRPKKLLMGIIDGLAANFSTALNSSSCSRMALLIATYFGISPDLQKESDNNKIVKDDVSNKQKKTLPIGFALLEYAIESKQSTQPTHVLPLTSIFHHLSDESFVSNKEQSKMSQNDIEAIKRLPLNSSNVTSVHDNSKRWVSIEGFVILCGKEIIDISSAHVDLIVTPSVRNHIRSISRILSGSKVPILLEGPTSSGKSSLVKFLCRLTGHRFVRINNHEHTDIQEYLGQHVIDPQTGALVFVEGAVAQAARYGHWVILDELNLASSEVLESLNRLLDDNRQLFIPETGVTIKAHPDFMVFATQNPASGAYGGRKLLSKAFRNRFIEIYIDEVPTTELDMILQKRCQLPPSFCKSMLQVYTELKTARLAASVFESSSSFMTIRDLLRWGNRRPDSREALALEGYYLIAERLRNDDEKQKIKSILEDKCLNKKKLVINYEQDHILVDVKHRLQRENLSGDLLLTVPMARLVALVQRCIQHNEPVLLVGETGTGKTSLCQILSKLCKRPLTILNCHQQTETADLLGAIQPIKDRQSLLMQVYNDCIQLFNIFLNKVQDNSIQHILIHIILNHIPHTTDYLDQIINFLCHLNLSCSFKFKSWKTLQDAATCIPTVTMNDALKRETQKPDIHMTEEKEDNDTFIQPIKRWNINELEHVLNKLRNGIDKAIELLQSYLTQGVLNNNCMICLEWITTELNEQSIQINDSLNKENICNETRILLSTGKRGISDITTSPELQQCTIEKQHKKYRADMSHNIINQLDCQQDLSHHTIMTNAFLVKELLESQCNQLVGAYQQSQKLFEWMDGPIVRCMKTGTHFLLDEISLADDATLERLNSVLESERTLVLAEKGGIVHHVTEGVKQDDLINNVEQTIETIIGKTGFRLFATMNPGGDYGKRELSPALRNRFTEIWVPEIQFDSPDTLYLIVEKLKFGLHTDLLQHLETYPHFILNLGKAIQSIICWYNRLTRFPLSVREVLAWISFLHQLFMTNTITPQLLIESFIHGGCLILIDPFGLGNHLRSTALLNDNNTYELSNSASETKSASSSSSSPDELFFNQILHKLLQEAQSQLFSCFDLHNDDLMTVLRQKFSQHGCAWIYNLIEMKEYQQTMLSDTKTIAKIDIFSINCLPNCFLNISFHQITKQLYDFTAPTAAINLGKILRALQLNRAILLEGPPGVGKTSIVQALADISGNQLIRINLSEQTDLADLLGSDIPGAERISFWNKDDPTQLNDKSLMHHEIFRWIDGILLRAMKEGHWVILDELNLASQQILEGLNALLDHRQQIYLPELDQVIQCHPNFRLFAAQNPTTDGGGRRGLPRSFLNRFSRITIRPMIKEDYEMIVARAYKSTVSPMLQLAMIELIDSIRNAHHTQMFQGGMGWEWNLRDLLRLCYLISKKCPTLDPSTSISLLLISRLRDNRDMSRMNELIQNIIKKYSKAFVSKYSICSESFYLRQEIGSQQSKQIFIKSNTHDSTDNTLLTECTEAEDLCLGTSHHVSHYIDGFCLPLNQLLINKGHTLSYIGDAVLKRVAASLLSVSYKGIGLPSQRDTLVRVAHSVAHNWAVMLTGPPGSGKSSLVRHLSQQLGTRLQEITLTEAMDATELLGTFEPENEQYLWELIEERLRDISSTVGYFVLYYSVSFENDSTHSFFIYFKQFIQNIPILLNTTSGSSIHRLDKIMESVHSLLCIVSQLKIVTELPNGLLDNLHLNIFSLKRLISITRDVIHRQSDAMNITRFKWSDGQLLQSIERGDWLLLRHIHFASPALLDRLNSLLEPNGFILLTECGDSQCIRPHPNFRIFFTAESSLEADAKMSKALRNRCSEIYIGQEVLNGFRLPLIKQLKDTAVQSQHHEFKSFFNTPSHSVSPNCTLNHMKFVNIISEMISNILDIVQEEYSDKDFLPYESVFLNIIQLFSSCLSKSLIIGMDAFIKELIDNYLMASSMDMNGFHLREFHLIASFMQVFCRFFFWSLSMFDDYTTFESFLTHYLLIQEEHSIGEDITSPIIQPSFLDKAKEIQQSKKICLENDEFHQFYSRLIILIRRYQLDTFSFVVKRYFKQWISLITASSMVMMNTSCSDFILTTFDKIYSCVFFPKEDHIFQYKIISFLKRILYACYQVSVLPKYASFWSEFQTVIFVSTTTTQQSTFQSSPSILPIMSVSSQTDLLLRDAMTLRLVLQHVQARSNVKTTCSDIQQLKESLSVSLLLYLERYSSEDWNERIDFAKKIITHSMLPPHIVSWLISSLMKLHQLKHIFEILETTLRQEIQRTYASSPDFQRTSYLPVMLQAKAFLCLVSQKQSFIHMIYPWNAPSDIIDEKFKTILSLYSIIYSLIKLQMVIPIFDKLDGLYTKDIKKTTLVDLHQDCCITLWDIRQWLVGASSFIIKELNKSVIVPDKIHLPQGWLPGPLDIQQMITFIMTCVSQIIEQLEGDQTFINEETYKLLTNQLWNIGESLKGILLLSTIQTKRCLLCPLLQSKEHNQHIPCKRVFVSIQTQDTYYLLESIKKEWDSLCDNRRHICMRLFNAMRLLTNGKNQIDFNYLYQYLSPHSDVLIQTHNFKHHHSLLNSMLRLPFSHIVEFLLDKGIIASFSQGLLKATVRSDKRDISTKDHALATHQRCTQLTDVMATLRCLTIIRETKSLKDLSVLTENLWETIVPQCIHILEDSLQCKNVVLQNLDRLLPIDIYIIIYIGKLLQIISLHLSSFDQDLNHSTTLNEKKLYLLKRYSLFFKSHVSFILSYASSICLMVICEPVFQASASLMAAHWIMDSSTIQQTRQTIVYHAYSAASNECFLRSRELFGALLKLDEIVAVKEGHSHHFISSLLSADSELLNELKNGSTGLHIKKISNVLHNEHFSKLKEPYGVHDSISVDPLNNIKLLDPDRFISWRTSLILSFCKQLGQNLRIGDVMITKSTALFFQLLITSEKDVESIVLNKSLTIQNNRESSQFSYAITRWTFVSQWFIDVFLYEINEKKLNIGTSQITNLFSHLSTFLKLGCLKESVCFKHNDIREKTQNNDSWLDQLILLLQTFIHNVEITHGNDSHLTSDFNSISSTCCNPSENFSYPAIRLVLHFLQWISIRQTRPNIQTMFSGMLYNKTLTDDELNQLLDRLSSSLLFLLGCWKMHSFASCMGFQARRDSALTSRLFELNDRVNELSFEMELRDVNSQLVHYNDQVPTASIQLLRNEIGEFKKIIKEIQYHLPLRPPLTETLIESVGKKNNQGTRLYHLLQELDCITSQDKHIEAQLDSLEKEISDFTTTVWSLKRLQSEFVWFEHIILKKCPPFIKEDSNGYNLKDTTIIIQNTDFSRSAEYLNFLFKTTRNFIHTLQQNYPLFPDIIYPLSLSFYAALDGLLGCVQAAYVNMHVKRQQAKLLSESNNSLTHSGSFQPSLSLIGHPETLRLNKPMETPIDQGDRIARMLWLCEWFDYTLQLNISEKTNFTAFMECLSDICQQYAADQEHTRKLEAEQFVRYIQQQGPEGHNTQDTEEQMTDYCMKLFPQGEFISEDFWLDHNLEQEENVNTNSIIEANEFHIGSSAISSQLESKNKQLPTTSDYITKLKQSDTNRFFNMLIRLTRTINSQLNRRTLTQHYSDDKTNGYPIWDPQLLMVSLGFCILDSKAVNTFLPPLIDKKCGSLASGALHHYVSMLQNAGAIDTLQEKYNILFESSQDKHTFLMDDSDSEDTHTTLTSEEQIVIAKRRLIKYKSQKIRFNEIQRLLKSSKIRVANISDSTATSFYSDAWPAVCVLIFPSIKTITSKTKELLQEFDSHPALLKILELTETIENLPVFHTTTMSLVNALELLLTRCEVWEKFAHRGVSLKTEVSPLRKHLLLLRHQQLNDWRHLRNFREEVEARTAYKWTPDLMIILQNILDSKDDNDIYSVSHSETNQMSSLSKDNCQTLWTYLEANTLSKSLGEFESRIHIIGLFGQLFQAMGKHDIRQFQLGCILGHFAAYSSLVTPKVEAALCDGRRAIDRQVKDLLRIMRWDFTRRDALKDSIQKGHFQLGKAIKKFDAYLQEPVIHCITQKNKGNQDDSTEIVNKTHLKDMVLRHVLFDWNQTMTKPLNKRNSKRPLKKTIPIASSISQLSISPYLTFVLNSNVFHMGEKLRTFSDLSISEWLTDLTCDVESALDAVDTTTSLHKKRWTVELKKKLIEELHLTPLAREPNLHIVMSDVGITHFNVLGTILFGLPNSSSTEYFNTAVSEFLNLEHLKQCGLDIQQIFKSIPNLWMYSQNCLYRQIRRYTQLRGLLPSCHMDLIVDSSHHVWLGLCGNVLEITQTQLQHVWEFGNNMTYFIDLLAVLTIPSYYVDPISLSDTLISIDILTGVLQQFLSFFGSDYETSLVTLPSSDDGINITQSWQSIASPTFLKEQEKETYHILLHFQQILKDIQTVLFESAEIRLFKRDASMSRLTFKLSQHLNQLITTLDHRVNNGSYVDACNPIEQLCERIISLTGIHIDSRRSVIQAILHTQQLIIHLLPSSLLTQKSNDLRLNFSVFVKEATTMIEQHDHLQSHFTAISTHHYELNDQSLDEKKEFSHNFSAGFQLYGSFPLLNVITTLKTHYLECEKHITQLNHNSEGLIEFITLSTAILMSALDTASTLGGLGILLSKITVVLFKSGYCREKDHPEDNDSQQETQRTKDDWTEGTGMGEGDGLRDITEQIEDENMMDGYKDEVEFERKKEEEKNDNKDITPMDVSMDIDGQLENKKKENELEKDDNDDPSENENLDENREMGDVDLNEGGELEKKQYDKEEGDSNDDEEDDNTHHSKENETIETHGASQQEDTELAANENPDDEQQHNKDNKPTEQQTTTNDNEGNDDDDDETDEFCDEAERQDQADTSYNVNLDQAHVDLEHTEDNDVDMDMENYQDNDLDNVSLQDENDNCDIDNEKEEDLQNDVNREQDPEHNDDMNDDDHNDTLDENEALESSNIDGLAPEDHKDINETDNELNDDQNQLNSQQDKKQDAQYGTDHQPANSNITPNKQETIESKQNDLKDVSNESMDTAAPTERPNGSPQGGDHDAGEGLTEGRSQATPAPSQSQQSNAPNPIKDKGEAVERWLKKVNLLQPDNDTEDELEKNKEQSETTDSSNKEHLSQGAECTLDTQSEQKGLAEVQESKDCLQNDHINEDETINHLIENEDNPENLPEPIDIQSNNQKLNLHSDDPFSDLKNKTDYNTSLDNKSPTDKDSHLEDIHEDDVLESKNKALQHLENQLTQCELQTSANELLGSTDLSHTEQQFSDNENNTSDILLLNNQTELSSQHDNVLDEDKAKSIWCSYGCETAAASADMSEKLRIILEPTIKGRYSGDFKTGKRLSMRKVVSFVASNFRRDKIWLRRCRPSRRDYRIIVALDNSRSMSECNVGQQALKAICTVLQSFQRLEIGLTGICSFGGTQPQVVLPLKENIFDDHIGAKIIQSFTFDKESDISHDQALPDLFNLSFNLFQQQTSPSHSAQHMLLILSDGRFNKLALRPKIYQALNQGIIPMLIILDPARMTTESSSLSHSTGSQSSSSNELSHIKSSRSIIDMKEVSWVDNKLIVKRYLDDFPFPFYAVIDNVTSVPGVVADVIRQWVEMLARK